jgi:hypothetical protein
METVQRLCEFHLLAFSTLIKVGPTEISKECYLEFKSSCNKTKRHESRMIYGCKSQRCIYISFNCPTALRFVAHERYIHTKEINSLIYKFASNYRSGSTDE